MPRKTRQPARPARSATTRQPPAPAGLHSRSTADPTSAAPVLFSTADTTRPLAADAAPSPRAELSCPAASPTGCDGHGPVAAAPHRLHPAAIPHAPARGPPGLPKERLPKAEGGNAGSSGPPQSSRSSAYPHARAPENEDPQRSRRLRAMLDRAPAKAGELLHTGQPLLRFRAPTAAHSLLSVGQGIDGAFLPPDESG